MDGAAIGAPLGLVGDNMNEDLRNQLTQYFSGTIQEAIRICGSSADRDADDEEESAESDSSDGQSEHDGVVV